jgi:S1-C subfamily serine protease
MGGGGFARIVMEALLGFHGSGWDYATAYPAHGYVADVAVAQEKKQRTQSGDDPCGWIGVAVSPMTTAFAESLAMAEPYGAIFDQPEPGSPAAAAHIEQGDVLTAINGSPLMRASDFAEIISAMAPGATVYLYTWRDGQPRQVRLIVGSAPCRTGGHSPPLRFGFSAGPDNILRLLPLSASLLGAVASRGPAKELGR